MVLGAMSSVDPRGSGRAIFSFLMFPHQKSRRGINDAGQALVSMPNPTKQLQRLQCPRNPFLPALYMIQMQTSLAIPTSFMCGLICLPGKHCEHRTPGRNGRIVISDIFDTRCRNFVSDPKPSCNISSYPSLCRREQDSRVPKSRGSKIRVPRKNPRKR